MVVIFAPIIKRWAESVRIPATKFLIPLSYATILGGMCTLIGTSTNLVVDGMILDAGYKGFGMFELGRVGIFIALAGIVLFVVFFFQVVAGGPERHGRRRTWGKRMRLLFIVLKR